MPRAARLLALPALAALAAVVPPPGAGVERVYCGGIYPHLQPILTSLSNLLPFACLDVMVAVALAIVGVCTGRSWRRDRRAARALGAGVTALAQALAAAYLVFLIAWGLGYRRRPADERFGVDRARLTEDRAVAVATALVAAVNADRGAGRDEARLATPVVAARLSPLVAATQRELGAGWSLTPGRPKRSLAQLVFPWSGVDGMVNPLALEVILNPEVLPFERPFVLAHEWGHLAGFTSEDEASFVAWLACRRSPDADVRYSGNQAVLLHVLRALPRDRATRVADGLSADARADIRALAARLAHARPAIQHASWSVYDRYLRANGVAEGLASYDQVVRLVLGARAATRDLP